MRNFYFGLRTSIQTTSKIFIIFCHCKFSVEILSPIFYRKFQFFFIILISAQITSKLSFTFLSPIKIVSHTIFIYTCLYIKNLVYYRAIDEPSYTTEVSQLSRVKTVALTTEGVVASGDQPSRVEPRECSTERSQ